MMTLIMGSRKAEGIRTAPQRAWFYTELVVYKEYWKLWDEHVPIRVSDLYEGFECKCTLELVKMLDNQASLEDVHKKFSEQNHSGMSHSLVRAMVARFCKRGKEFDQYENV